MGRPAARNSHVSTAPDAFGTSGVAKLCNSNETTARLVMRRLADIGTPGLLRVDNGSVVALPAALPALLREIERGQRDR